MKTGVIGLGAMGAGMALNLHRAGFLTAFWNRSPQPAHLMAEQSSMAAANSPAQLAAQCELIITCVSRDEDVVEVITAMMPGLATGAVVVDTSTVSADTAIKVRDLLATINVSFLDAPVSGGVEGARNGTMAMMVGGEKAALDRVYPVLQSIAGKIRYMGKSGSGQATKAVNQIMVAGIAQAVTEALAFGQAMELDMDRVIDVVGSGAAGNWFLDHRGKTMVNNRFDPGFKLALHHKDLLICRQMAQAKNQAALLCVDETLRDYEQLMSEGFGDEDISSLFRLKQRAWHKA